MPAIWVRCAVAGLVAGTPVATWWHVGQLGVEDGPGFEAAVLVRPPRIDPAVETAAGRLATALAVLSLAALAEATRRQAMDPRRWRVLVASVALGAFCGAYERVLTTRTPGWDMGSTLLGLFLALPFGVLVFTLLLIWVSTERRDLRLGRVRSRWRG